MNKNRPGTLATLRQRKATTGFLTANETFVYNILAKREAGITRQATAAEIAPCVHGVWASYNRCPECKAK
jgi:hypothetical protein